MHQTIQPNIQPAAMKMTAPSMAATSAPAADIISPNEAKFWSDWADKAPTIIRSEDAESVRMFRSRMLPVVVGGVGLGAALGIASFTKYVHGYWKILTGVAAIGAFAGSMIVGNALNVVAKTSGPFEDFANVLEQRPELRRQLADTLSRTVTKEDIQKLGIEKAVTDRITEFAITMVMNEMGCRQLQPLGMSRRA